jgi:cytochrome c2
MVSALSTGHQIGLALVAVLFIAFSLVSSFVLPRRNPDFPGRWRNVYLVVCGAFFAAMMAAVLLFGVEEKKNEAEAASGGATSGETTQAAGDPAHGKALFAQDGCGACHTFKPAGSNGKVGPDLDNLAEAAKKAGKPLDEFIAESIEDPNAYIAPGFKAGVMPPFKLTTTQRADLVAFLSSGSHS